MTTKLREAPGRPASGRVQVDPRIRRRRVEITRAEGRRRLRLLAALTAMVVLVAGAWGLTRSPLLDLDSVRITGSTRTLDRTVVATSGLRTGQAMVDIDENAAARRLSKLPWVASATVTRHWPGAVTIAIVERAPAVAVEAGAGRWALVDENARVLDIVAERPAGLVPVIGLRGLGAAGSVLPEPGPDLLAVALQVPDGLSRQVAGVTPATSPQGGVELMLEGGARLLVGTPDRLMEKFRAALTVLARVNTGDMESLDVRVPESPVLTRRSQDG